MSVCGLGILSQDFVPMKTLISPFTARWTSLLQDVSTLRFISVSLWYLFATDKDILRQLESAQFPEVCEGCNCYQLSLQNISTLGALEGEQRILEFAIEELKWWLAGS